MDFLSRLFGSSGAKSKSKAGYVRREGRHAVWIYVQCSRCGEKIPVRLRTTSELQRREGPDAQLGPGQFFVRKTVVGKKCYQRIEATVDFDGKYDVVDSKMVNGKLITYEEYKKDEH
ncbi:MAG TPA: hypothetical protein DDX25_01735 [Firmicutes bacterium]|jgi:hypothetical protein|nr:hypothetical protein [Bacillota bacterium]